MECINFVRFHFTQTGFFGFIGNHWIDQIIRYAMLFKKLEHRLIIVPHGFKRLLPEVVRKPVPLPRKNDKKREDLVDGVQI